MQVLKKIETVKTVKKRIRVLCAAKIEEQLNIKTAIIEAAIDPVYENGMKFSGSVLVDGYIYKNLNQKKLQEVVQKELQKITEFVTIRKVEIL